MRLDVVLDQIARAPREITCWSAFPRRAKGKPDRVRITQPIQSDG